MFNLQITAIAAAVALSLGAASAWWLTAEYKDNKLTAKIEAQKAEAATLLQKATELAIAKDKEYNILSTKLEIENAEKQSEHDAILSDNRRLVAKLGGMRDPGHRKSCASALPTKTGTSKQSTTEAPEGQLSDAASEFLLNFARNADRAAQYASTCHDWLNKIK